MSPWLCVCLLVRCQTAETNFEGILEKLQVQEFVQVTHQFRSHLVRKVQCDVVGNCGFSSK